MTVVPKETSIAHQAIVIHQFDPVGSRQRGAVATTCFRWSVPFNAHRMGTDQPEIQSRRTRLLAYLRWNRSRMIVDLALLASWLLVTSTLFGVLGLPNWLFYAVLFAGVIVYARITPPWERPYSSPDWESDEPTD